jgi:23S rRNA pseudouridine2457 synthase
MGFGSRKVSVPVHGTVNTQRRAPISLVAGAQSVALLLANAGYGTGASLIVAGRVALNGRTLLSATAQADPLYDVLTVDGQAVNLRHVCRYLAFHKPYRVLTCFTDSEGRPTLADYVAVQDIHAVGRLDSDSEGLLLLSDDGWLLHRLTHPLYEHPKTYLVQVENIPNEQALEALRRGVIVEGQVTRPAEVTLLQGEAEPQVPPRSVPIRYQANIPAVWLRVVLREGRKHQLRHMTAAVGHPTLRLLRNAIGPITLGDLAPGQSRALTHDELQSLAIMLHRPRRQIR